MINNYNLFISANAHFSTHDKKKLSTSYFVLSRYTFIGLITTCIVCSDQREIYKSSIKSMFNRKDGYGHCFYNQTCISYMDRPGTCIILDKKYNIANSSYHFESYGSIWTGPYTQKLWSI
jgi:hypothetical protein